MRTGLFKMPVLFVGLLASALSPAQNVISVYQIDGSVRVYDKVDSIVCTTDNQEIHSMGRIYSLPVSDVDSVVYESFADFVTPGQEVDLGLSVKWAGWNVGANRPEEYGGYYAWGETEEKAGYTKSAYSYYDQTKDECIQIGSNISGTQYDVAHIIWGDNWRMPVQAEFQELKDECKWEWVIYNEVYGQKVTGPNGNSIFIPAAGEFREELFGLDQDATYWSATLCGDDEAGILGFNDKETYWGSGPRYYGLPVRPVYDTRTVQSQSAATVTENSAVLSALVYGIAGSSTECRYGFFFGRNPVPSVDGNELEIGSNRDGEYSCILSGLEDNTTYYYCAYLQVGGIYYYGDVMSFTTPEHRVIQTVGVKDVMSNSAMIFGFVDGISGSSSDCRYGFFYSTSPDPTIGGHELYISSNRDGNFSCTLAALSANTTYYYCAYLSVDGVYTYGEINSFTTTNPASVQTGGVSEVTANSAVLSGVVDGISGVSGNYRYGFFYSTSPTPYNGGQEYAVSVSENGSFTYPVSGLAENTTYYYCAYLWIDGRFSYGEVYSFTTEKASPVKTLGTVSVKSTSATLSGSVYGVAGSYSECSYGFCYGTSPKPYVDGEEVEAGTYEDGEYTFSLYDLDDMTTYYYCAYLSIDGEYSYGEVLSFTTPKSNTDITPGQYVDLGLSVKWTSCNIGADAPEEYGGYYSWGEVSEKDDYSWGNYTYYDMVQYKWIKIGTNISGTEYDVARRRWGIDWRMPTREEWTELVEKCEWEWITYKGTKGQKVTGPNGNSIFFPAAGHRTDDLFVGQGTGGEYWSGTLYEGSSLAIWYNGMAYLGAFSDAGSYMIYYTRDVGRSVRAVLAH